MYHVVLGFRPIDERIDGRHITAKGLHGLLFNALKLADPPETDWLHDHDVPKPFSLAPLYTDEGDLAGLRLGALTDRAAGLFVRAWEWHREQERPLEIGRQPFKVASVTLEPGPSWLEVTQTLPGRRLALRFLSPTSFRQGPGHSPLPVPYNVFHWPWRVWCSYAPPLNLPDGWLEWCRDDVFVIDHQIETARVAVAQNESFTGFVGEVVFEAYRGTPGQLRLLQALGRVAAYSGIGHKTTMGMGAVEVRGDRVRR